MKLTILFCCFAILFGQAQDKPQVVVTTGHTMYVYSIAFSNNNKYIATGGQDNTIRIWDKALQQEFQVLTGHLSGIYRLAFTSDNQYLVSQDNSGEIITWDFINGKILQRQKKATNTISMAYVPNTHSIWTQLSSDSIVLLDILTKKISKQYKAGNGGGIELGYDQKHLLITNEHSQVVSLNVTEGVVIQEVSSKGKIPFLFKTGVRHPFVAIHYFGLPELEVKNYLSNNLIGNVPLRPAPARLIDIEFSATDSVVLLLYDGGYVDGYNIYTKELVKQFNMPSSNIQYQLANVLEFSPDHSILAIGLYAYYSNDKVSSARADFFTGAALFDYNTTKRVGALAGYYRMMQHLSVDATDQYLYAAGINVVNGLRTWNLKEGELERFTMTSMVFAASADGSTMAYYNLDTASKVFGLQVYSLPAMDSIFTPPVKYLTVNAAMNETGTFLVTAEADMNVNALEIQKAKGCFSIWNLKTKKLSKRIDIKGLEASLGNKIILDRAGKYLTAHGNSMFKVWDLTNSKLIFDSSATATTYSMYELAPEANSILVSQLNFVGEEYDASTQVVLKNNFYLFDYTKGTFIPIPKLNITGHIYAAKFSLDGRFLAVAAQLTFNHTFDVLIYDWATKQLVCTLKGHNTQVNLLDWSKSANKLYSMSADAIIKVWDIDSCALKASFMSFNTLDYLILSPDGYYKTSKNNPFGLAFRYKDNLYAFDQFDIQLNRPDKVMESLGLSSFAVKTYTRAYNKRLERLGLTAESLNSPLATPTISIKDKYNIPFNTYDSVISIQVQAYDTLHTLDRLCMSINYVPLNARNGIHLSGKDVKNLKNTYSIPLSEGKNLVQVSVFNDIGLESMRESFEINYTPKKVVKPNLYILGIGVGEFKDTIRNLRYPKKDIQDFVATMQTASNYQEVIPLLLYNQEVTKENILKQAAALRKANKNDRIVIFISSHGLLDDNLDYYLATHDIDFKNPSLRGLPYSAVETILDSLACRNRLVLIDACHSGEVDKTEAISKSSVTTSEGNVTIAMKSGTEIIRPKVGTKTAFMYMKNLFADMSQGTGATVIAAASGYEFALESGKWNNGVFTFALLNGLKNGFAEYDGIKGISLSELRNYVETQVFKLTDGKQQPTTRSENSLSDFILYEK